MKKRTSSQINILFKNIGKTINLYWRIRPKMVLGMTFILIGVALTPLLSSYVNGQLINGVVSLITDEGNVSVQTVFIFLAVLLFLNLLTEVLFKVTDWFDKVIHYDMNEEMGYRMTKQLSSLDLAKMEDPKLNTLLSKVRQGYDNKVATFASSIMWIITDFIQLVASLVLIISISPVLIPLVGIGLIPEFLVRIRGSKARWGIWDAKGEINKQYWALKDHLTREREIKEIRIFGATSYLLESMRSLLKDFLHEQRVLSKKETWQSVISKMFELFIFGGIEVWLLLRVIAQQIGVGDYTFYLRIIDRFGTSSRNLLRSLNRLYELNLFMSDLFTVLEIESEITVPPDATILDPVKIPTIEFKNVTFSYPGETSPIFHNFSITIKPGEDIALVGENGAGKTTFVKLLCRFYDVDDGEILIDGVNVKQLDISSWHNQLGVLFQDFNQYAMSARENIILGRAEVTDEKRMMDASKMAGSDSFITKFKNGYSHILSKWFFDGTEISGGQWQRVALARSFYRDANILILDEPTSAIDPKGEYEIFHTINKTQQGKTTIIISHRFSTVRNADHIYVIDNGAILEHGSHEQLLSQNGVYATMFEMQAEGYR